MNLSTAAVRKSLHFYRKYINETKEMVDFSTTIPSAKVSLRVFCLKYFEKKYLKK